MITIVPLIIGTVMSIAAIEGARRIEREVLPLGLSLTFEPDSEWITRWISGDGVRPLAVLSQALFAWMMTLGLMGLFQRLCARENNAVRYVSDSSYWLYVAHVPLIFAAQALIKPLNLPAIGKFVIVCVGVTAVLLLTYDRAIRYSWLGTLLNGKRTRPARTQTSPGS